MGLCVVIVFRLLDVAYLKLHTVHCYCYFVAPMSVYPIKNAGKLVMTVKEPQLI